MAGGDSGAASVSKTERDGVHPFILSEVDHKAPTQDIPLIA
jgi:hypothetical protein